jgi:hypothetical protein
MTDARNANRARLDDVATDKGIARVVRPGTEPPPGLLSMTPLNSNPHGASAPPRQMADTRAAAEFGPITPGGMPRQTPPGAAISPDVARALPNQAPGIAERVREFVKRK